MINQLNIKTCEDMLAAWNSGEEMLLTKIGRHNEYELPLQLAMFEALGNYVAQQPNLKDWSPNRPDILALNAAPVGRAVMTGAVSVKAANRAMHQAYMYYRAGYEKALSWQSELDAKCTNQSKPCAGKAI